MDGAVEQYMSKSDPSEDSHHDRNMALAKCYAREARESQERDVRPDLDRVDEPLFGLCDDARI